MEITVLVFLDDHARELVLWWVNNVALESKSLLSSSPDLELFADACLTGWGAVVGSMTSGGSWAHAELDHINCLELQAFYLVSSHFVGTLLMLTSVFVRITPQLLRA